MSTLEVDADPLFNWHSFVIRSKLKDKHSDPYDTIASTQASLHRSTE